MPWLANQLSKIMFLTYLCQISLVLQSCFFFIGFSTSWSLEILVMLFQSVS